MKNNITKTWEKIYQKWFNLKKDFSAIKVPENYDPEKHFAVIVSQELTMREIVAVMRKRFNVWLFSNDLDGLVQDDRTAKDGSYIILFNKNIEADEEFKNLSANQLKETSHKGITLMERLLLEVLYFDKTKEHLDINNWTLCSSSRYSDGGIPYVRWGSSNSGLNVHWSCSDYVSGYLRSRVVVS